MGVPCSYVDTAAVTRHCSGGGGGFLWALELYDAHSPVHPDPCPPPGAGMPGSPLQEEAAHFRKLVSGKKCLLGELSLRSLVRLVYPDATC